MSLSAFKFQQNVVQIMKYYMYQLRFTISFGDESNRITYLGKRFR